MLLQAAWGFFVAAGGLLSFTAPRRPRGPSHWHLLRGQDPGIPGHRKWRSFEAISDIRSRGPFCSAVAEGAAGGAGGGRLKSI